GEGEPEERRRRPQPVKKRNCFLPETAQRELDGVKGFFSESYTDHNPSRGLRCRSWDEDAAVLKTSEDRESGRESSTDGRTIETAVHAPDAVLCVDLDGTLIKSDSLYDALCLMLRHHPRELLRL